MAERSLVNATTKVYCDVEFDSSSLYTEGVATHKQTHFKCPSKGYKVFTHEFTLAAKSQYVERINKVLLTQDRLVRVRLGFAAGSVITWDDWEWHRILSCVLDTASLSAGNTPVAVTLVTADELAWLDVSSRVTARRGVVSDQVAEIMSAYPFGGMPMTSSIEPTPEKFSFIQSYQTDYEFIDERLRFYANNAQSQGNYLLFTRGHALHFHTPGWKVRDVWVCSLTGSGSPTLSTSTDGLFKAFADGGAGVETTAYDPLTDATLSRETSADIARRYSDLAPAPSGTRQNPVHVGQNRTGAELARAQSVFEMAKTSTYRLSFVVSGQSQVGVGDLIRIESPVSSTAGYYYVESIEGHLFDVALKVALTVCRGEIGSPAPASGAGSQDQYAAPGRMVDVRSASSSPAVNGNSRERLITGTAVPVMDPG